MYRFFVLALGMTLYVMMVVVRALCKFPKINSAHNKRPGSGDIFQTAKVKQHMLGIIYGCREKGMLYLMQVA